MLSIGQQLSGARAARDLTIEDVAFHTHIPAGKVRDMENDDLSRFANLTYARGFLKIYSQFLGLDISDYLEQFSTAELARASGHEYVRMANATRNLPAAVFTDYGRARRPGLYILFVLAIAGGGIVWWNNRPAPAEESGPLDVNPPLSSTESAETLLPSPAAKPPIVPPELPAANAAVEKGVPAVSSTQDNAVSGPPDPTVKPPKAAVVEEEEEPPPASQGTRRPD